MKQIQDKKISFLLTAILVIAILTISGCIAPPPASTSDNNYGASSGDAAESSGRDLGSDDAAEGYGEESAEGESAADEAADSSATEEESAAKVIGSDASGARGGVPADRPSNSARYQPVTAGVVDDNEEWAAYLEYRRRTRVSPVRDRDVSERYLILVQDENSLPIHDAQVTVYVGNDPIFEARSDAGGRVLFHPLALERRGSRSREYKVTAQKGYIAERRTFERHAESVWPLTLTDAPTPGETQLDLLFLVDATGSMDDEIAKLKASMADIADQIDQLQERPDVRYGLVHYRDRGDDYIVQTHDFTDKLNKFQSLLSGVRADGGGDTPESLNEALHRSLNEMSWREQKQAGETVRLIILVADAPPHLDYRWQDYSYESDMIVAAGMGVKIFTVGASGLQADGEFIFRQLAQFTGGQFVFLTYEDGSDPSSGPGTETEHDVDNYSVNTLDKLVVRLVREELAKLTQPIVIEELMAAVAKQVPTPQPTRRPRATPTRRPTPTPRPIQPVSCELDLDAGRNNCGGIAAIQYIDMERASRYRSDGQALMKLNLNQRRTGYSRFSLEVIYDEQPQGWTVNIGDSVSNDGYGGDGGHQSNDAEAVLLEGSLIVYANDYVPDHRTTDGHRELAYFDDVVRADETVYFEVKNHSFNFDAPGGTESIESPYLYALAGQPDREGRINHDLFVAFNRTVHDASRSGIGVSKVVVTLYPR